MNPGDRIELLMEASLKTFAERNASYGNNFLNVGKAMLALFPNGITLQTAEDFTRFHILELNVVKLCRYCNNFVAGGHDDSIHDQGVYAFILQGIDEAVRQGDLFANHPRKTAGEDVEEIPFDPYDPSPLRKTNP